MSSTTNHSHFIEQPGRGAGFNPTNRFEEIEFEEDGDYLDGAAGEPRKLKTRFFKDSSQSIITTNNSPDVGFEASLNPYRGCEHGCIYCYARPFHEYLGFSSGLDFESKIMVKPEAPALLRKELSAKKWEPKVLVMSGVTDCYQPIERKLGLTRKCLEVLLDFRNPVAIITKNKLVERDADLLRQLAAFQCAKVIVSVTTLDGSLTRILEPRSSQPESRLAGIETLAKAGIPVNVNVAPIIPGLTDHEIPAILKAAAAAGAQTAGYTLVRLPYAVAPLFEQWLETHAPQKKEKVLSLIRSIRGGKLYDARFGARMSGEGLYADQIAQLFEVSCKKFGLNRKRNSLTVKNFRNAGEKQLQLFD